MSQDEMTLVCEGQPRGRDVRWLGLVMGQLSETLDIAGKVRVVPAGSKADLGAAVRGLRESLRTARIYGIRDRDSSAEISSPASAQEMSIRSTVIAWRAI